jgi:hypothetical protein
MKTMRYFLLYVITGMLVLNSYAGTKVPVDGSGEVVYKHTFKLQSNFTDQDAYAMIQDWFSSGAGKFTAQNETVSAGGTKNKALVEEAFDNSKPLQSLDPASGRVTGKGLIKYFGSAASSIGALYMEYYIVLEVNGHQLTATVSKMKYHHFNQRTFAAKPIYGWQGGKPLDSADKLGALVNSADENRDILDVAAFVNKNVVALFGNLQAFLQSKTLIDAQSLSSASAKED